MKKKFDPTKTYMNVFPARDYEKGFPTVVKNAKKLLPANTWVEIRGRSGVNDYGRPPGMCWIYYPEIPKRKLSIRFDRRHTEYFLIARVKI